MRFAISALLALALLWGGAVALGEDFDREADAIAFFEQVIAGEHMDTLWARFTPQVQAQMSEAEFATVGEMFTLLFGEVVAIKQTQVIGSSVTLYVQTSGKDAIVQVVYTDDEQIAGFGFLFDEAAQIDTTPLAGEEPASVGPKALEGLLLIPEGAEGKLAAVVLVHGSGPSDRNETIGSLSVFRDIAQGLAQRGIASLRYDKRTYAWNTGALAYTTEELENLTVYEETIEDAVAAVQLLKADPRIDPDRVFIIGHSQGGMLATRMQQAGAQADGLIILAGTLRHINALAVDQLEAAVAGGAYGMESEIETARAIPDMTEEEARARTLLGSNAYPIWEEARHDLYQAAEENDAPMLILQGEADVQVYADRDYPLWEAFAAEHTDKDIELILYPGLGHLFDVDGAVSPQVIADMADWILER